MRRGRTPEVNAVGRSRDLQGAEMAPGDGGVSIWAPL